MKFSKRLFTGGTLSLLLAAVTGRPKSARADGARPTRTVDVAVKGGYQPGRVEVSAGEQVQFRFVRHESGACTREVVFPALGIRKELPEGQATVVPLPELTPGEYDFHCGMGMVRGKLVVRGRA